MLASAAFAQDAPPAERLASGVVNIPANAAGLTTSEFPSPLFTTPIAYLTALPQDPTLDPPPDGRRRDYGYLQSALMRDILLRQGFTASALGIEPAYGGYRFHAAGPDGYSGPDMKVNIPCDPTNGTVSNGDLVRSQRDPELRLVVEGT